VNFVGSIVNRHKIEAFVLDSSGRIVATFERLSWSEEELVASVTACLGGKSSQSRLAQETVMNRTSQTLPSARINHHECQFARNVDPLFASKFDPV